MEIDPPSTIGAESFQSDLFYLAGGKNEFADVKKDYFRLDGKELVSRNPDLIIICGTDETEIKQKLKDSPVYKNLAAVKNDSTLGHPLRPYLQARAARCGNSREDSANPASREVPYHAVDDLFALAVVLEIVFSFVTFGSFVQFVLKV